MFEIIVVEGGTRIGGRINSSEFIGNKIELGAAWIHGIQDNPIFKIAEEINVLDSVQPWESMDGFSNELTHVAEGGFNLSPCIVNPISNLFNKLMDFARHHHDNGFFLSLGSFLRNELDLYLVSKNGFEEAVFAMHENTLRIDTACNDLSLLDFCAENERGAFPGEEITIAKGYMTIIESIASVLPPGLVQLGKKVIKIEWKPEGPNDPVDGEKTHRPVKLYFSDGLIISADHVIVTVSLGVLKAGIQKDSDFDSGMFHPPLPSFKTKAISRLGYGVVNKLFLQLGPVDEDLNTKRFPFLNLVFDQAETEVRDKKIPWWIRRIDTLHPIYKNSSVLLGWFTGEEALHLEKLSEEEIIEGVSMTIDNFLPKILNTNSNENGRLKIIKVVKSEWGTDPLFLGSYCYVRVGSSGDDLDTMAEPLPKIVNNKYSNLEESKSLSLQLMFAGEATHRTHYSTTHGAHLSGLREANRLLHHYNCL